MRISRRTGLLAAGAALALAASACGGSSGGGGDGTGPQGQVIYVESTDNFTNLFPPITAGNVASVRAQEIQILPRPFRTEPDLNFHADLNVLAGEPKADTVNGKFTVTYQLNDKAVWSDGTPLTWKDFEYTWRMQRSNDPKKGGCTALLASTGFEQIGSVAAGSSDKQVVVTYDKPFVDWKSIFQPLYPEHLMDKHDAVRDCAVLAKGWPTQDGLPGDISAGPWQLLKKNINFNAKTYVLTPNPRWWGAPVGVARLIYRNLGNDAGVLTKALQAAEVDCIGPQPQLDLVAQVGKLKPKVTSEITFGLTFEHLDMNTRNPDLAHPEVRKAIALALDRADLVHRTVGEFDSRAAVLNNHLFVPNQAQYKDNSGGQYSAPDIAKAASLLESVGYKRGGDGIYALNGHRLSLEIMTTVNNKLRQNTIDIITAQLKQVGIQIKMSLNPNIFAGADKDKHSLAGGDFDMALFAWLGSPAVADRVPIYHSVQNGAQQQNYVWGSDPKVDELLGKMLVEPDGAKAAGYANQADAQLWDDMYTIPLYQKPNFLACSSKLTPYDEKTKRGVGENSSQDSPAWNSGTWTVQ